MGHPHCEPQPTILAHPGPDDALRDEQRQLSVVGEETHTFNSAELRRQERPHAPRAGDRQDLLSRPELHRRTQRVADPTAQ